MTVLAKGVSAFPITPADADGTVDAGALHGLVARLAKAGVDSIGLLGSTGTYPFLTRAERRRALETGLAAAGGVPVLVGIGALRTDETVRLARDAKAAGATAGLLAAVSYTPLTDDEVFTHFATVAREVGLPLCIYDNPATTHFRFTPALVARLARLPEVVAIKSTAPEPAVIGAHLAELRAAVPAGCVVGYSGDWHCTEALSAGADAWFSVVAGLFPAPALEIARAVAAGDLARARALDARLKPLWDLFRRHSSLRVIYAAAGLTGLVRAVPPRPLLPLNPEIEAEVAATLKALDLA